jgi:hypothetical protein
MKTLEGFVLGIADSDYTWVGFNWMRPSTRRRVGLVFIFSSSFLLGLSGLLLGAALIYLVIGHLEYETAWFLFLLVMAVELALHLLFAHYWNARVDRLVR